MRILVADDHGIVRSGIKLLLERQADVSGGWWQAVFGRGDGDARAVRRLLDDRRLTATVLFLGCVFVPSGVWLLWRFTSWETMHAAAGPADLPAWLVAAFALTNVTQGVLGYMVTRALWRRGHRYHCCFG